MRMDSGESVVKYTEAPKGKQPNPLPNGKHLTLKLVCKGALEATGQRLGHSLISLFRRDG